MGRISDFPVGSARSLTVAGVPVALFRTERGFVATDGRCPHRGGPLAEGDLVRGEIVCPWHLWGFDLVTGACGGNPEISIAIHEVKVEGDRVLVRLASVPEPARPV